MGTEAAATASPHEGDGSWRAKLLAFVDLPVLKSRGAQLLLVLRLLMALAFNLYAPVWQVSIKKRFDFGPSDHAKLMGIIGFTYALSQGAIAKPLIRLFNRDPSKLLLLCIAILGGFRPFALRTPYVGVVYALYVPMVIALGVMNTAIATACSSLADGDQLGGLFGVLESVESVAGMVGPALGGVLAAYYDDLPLHIVLACYTLAFALVAGYYKRHLLIEDRAVEKKVQ